MEDMERTSAEEIKEETPDYRLEDLGRRLRVLFLKYFITALVGLGFFFLVLWLRGFYDIKNLTKSDYYRILSDGFAVPGMLLICLAATLFIYQEGAFTGLLYALRHVGRMMLPFLIKNDVSYLEYLEGRGERTFMSMILCFFLVGAAYVAAGIICVALYYKYVDMPYIKQIEASLFFICR